MSFTLLRKRKSCFGLDDLQEGQLITRQQYFSLYNEVSSGSYRIFENPDRENNRYKVSICGYKTVNFYVEGVYPYLHEFISQERQKLKNLKTT